MLSKRQHIARRRFSRLVEAVGPSGFLKAGRNFFSKGSGGSDAASGADFDPSFYRETYPDLSHLSSDAELYNHYVNHSRADGRFGSLHELNMIVSARYGPPPADFNPRDYLELHTDLQKLGMTPNQTIEHYMRYGREEGRAYVRMNSDLFRELYLNGQIISDADLFESLKDAAFSEGKLRTGRDVMQFKGLEGGGRWIEALKLEEFRALNADWASSATTLMGAVDAMLDEGVRRLAPIADALTFDPAFYREYQTEVAGASDEDAYRHWLFTGFEEGLPGSTRQFFEKLNLPLEAFPTGFAWERYVASDRTNATIRTRWAALEQYVSKGFAADSRFASGKGGHEFLAALGALFHRRNATLCIRALEAAQKIAPLNDTSTQQLGDAYFGLEKWALALSAYGAVFGKPSAAPGSYCNAARAALNMNDIDGAFGILTQYNAKVTGAPEWRVIARDAINTSFEQALEKMRDLLKLGMRESAEILAAEAVKQVAERYAAIDPLGAPIAPPSPTGRVLILANVDLRQCTHYRVEQKQELLEALERDYAVYPAAETDAFVSALPFASAAIFYRLPASPKTVRAIEVARAMGIPTYYEIDDLLFDRAEYPEPFETYGNINRSFYQSLQLGVPLFRAAMSLCDYGLASTTALAERMKPIVRKREAFVLPNGLDSRNLTFLTHPPSRVRRDESIVIFYGSGTKAHNSDFLDLAGPALKAIMARRLDVKLMIVGYLTLDASFDAFRDRIISVGIVPDVRAYWSLLAEADINIAVLAPFATTDAKSEIKWIEAAALGLPSVVSSTHRYREVLENGVDAFVAATSEEWREALEKLIDDPSLRRRMAEAARRKLQRDYTPEGNASHLARLLETGLAAARAQSPSPKRKRLLLVNLFFHPQSLGGSPRVVKDNLDCFLDGAAPEDFEFAVAATDFGGEGLGQVRVESYRRCPVFRISPVAGINTEWQYNLPQMGSVFKDILQTWRPDLVHFHCVQRFSGAIVEACLNAGIPYVVTTHDAWWVSDWQFLTDAKNRLRQPGEAYPFDPPTGVSVGEALDRRRYLTALLNQADAVLGVSHAFAQVYRASGFPQTRAVPNGAPRMTKQPRVSSPSGRVRLCHVGGMSKFKGFNLLRAALQRSLFTHLELTVVDESRYGGAERSLVWGATPVRIVGKRIAEEMPFFYARHDVLLAPSLWPEAFGLVSREALAMGLWVVASDRGAMGEDVTPEVNGFVIDVATPEPLLRVLAHIDSEPGKFTTSPPARELRTAQRQAEELVVIYQEIMAQPQRKQPTPPRIVAVSSPSPSSHDLRRRERADQPMPDSKAV